MEDLDRPREIAGAAERLLKTLEAFGFEWDGPCVRQSDRIGLYHDALADLRQRDLLFNCTCSRASLAEDARYPGICRDAAHPAAGTASRLRTPPGYVMLQDRIQGLFRQDVATATGDFIVRRRDGIVAYVLAVVVDDAAQGITHIVRGADLLDNTPRQIHLQRLLGLPTPVYAHVPVLCEPGGVKLAKSRRSVDASATLLDTRAVNRQLHEVFGLLGLEPAPDLRGAAPDELWNWAKRHWSIKAVPARLALHLDG